MKKAYLVLSNGMVFEGEAIGASGSTVGELVFTTGMCGYIETLTDESYEGQIVLQTFPLIGNYGIIEEDFEGKCAVAGYVVRECCKEPSNFRSEYDLDAFLKKQNVVGISGVDTREITRIIREQGVMNAKICGEKPAELTDLTEIESFRIEKAVERASCTESYLVPAEGEAKYKVALIDYGAKKNIIRELNRRGCDVTVVPYNTAAETLLSMNIDAIMLSNGPGDPSENTGCIEELKKLIGRIPIFGICLGHQLLAIANGYKTVKLKYGHRGANQPVRDCFGTRTYITSQNHGYAVEIPKEGGAGKISFVNANDGTCEGIDYPSLRCFSVQFHPEASSGPHDTSYLFDKFLGLVGGES